MNADQNIESLREAVRFSPENIPLRRHLAESLLVRNLSAEAEIEFRTALALAPDDVTLKLGLATAFFQQGKHHHAAAILEAWTKSAGAHAKAFLLYSRLSYQAGDIEEAERQYRLSIEADPSMADAELAERLGIPDDFSESEADLSDEEMEIDEDFEARLRAVWNERNLGKRMGLERSTHKFSDVGGMESVKDEIRIKIIHPINHPELYRAYGKAMGGGILLYGPLGCGKTYLARATAGEISAGFLVVGINDVIDMWIGHSERNLHAFFEKARANTPCVLFFDEVDALAASRADLKTSAGCHLTNQFLSELDGLQRSNEGVLILAATNAPWHLDPAFRRPGRFDRILFVPPPDALARSGILRLLCRNKPIHDIDFDQVAKNTENLSGADLKSVVDLAIESKLHEAMKLGIPKPLVTKDLLVAAAAVCPSTREWFATAKNHAIYSNQGGIYDDVLKYLKLS